MMNENTLATYKEVYRWAENAERPGGEFDWFAIDALGHIATFGTAGLGPVPDSVFESGIDAFLKLIAVLEKELPHTCALHAGGFAPYSERGLFAFDFKAMESGQYERQCVPTIPLTMKHLHDYGIQESQMVLFCGVFSSTTTIVPEDHWKCR